MRESLGARATKLMRLFGSDRNTRISQQVIVILLGVTVMGTVMDALFDMARIMRPVSRVEAFLGIEHGRAPAAPSVRSPRGD